jgi:tetratricopeptide (TPR) repeat protein
MSRSYSLRAAFLLILSGCLSNSHLQAAPGSKAESMLGYVDGIASTQGKFWLTAQIARFRKYPRLDLAFRLLKEGRTAEAQTELKGLLDRNPKDAAALTVQMAILQQEKDYPAVIKVAERLLKLYPSFPPAYMYRGLAYQAMGESRPALEDFLILANIPNLNDRDRVFSLETISVLAPTERRYADALAAIDRLTAINGSSSVLLYRKGIALEGLNRHDEAVMAFKAALRTAGESDTAVRVVIFKSVGALYGKQGNWKLAAQAYSNAVALDPNRPDLIRALAHAAYRSGDYQESGERMRQLLAITSNAEDRLYLARVSVAEKDYRSAERELRLILLESNNAQQRQAAYGILAEIARHRKDNSDIRQFLEVLLRQKPETSGQQLLLTLLRLENDRPALTRELQEIVSSKGTTRAELIEAFRELGNLYLAEDQAALAVSAFEEVVKRQRTPHSLNDLTEALVRAGRIREAAISAEEGLHLQPTPQAYIRAATLNAELDRIPDALAELDAALSMRLSADAGGDIYLRKGYLLQKQKRSTDAADAFSRAAQLDPKNAEARIAAAEIYIEQHNYLKALSYLEQARSLERSKRVTQMLAVAYAGAGEGSKAIAEYQEILNQAKPTSLEREQAALNIAYLKARAGDAAASADFLRKAFTESAGAHPEYLLQAADRYFSTQAWESARDTYVQYLNITNSDGELRAKAWESLGYTYERLGQRQLSANAFRKAVDQGLDTEQAHENLAFALYGLQQWEAARAEFLLASEREPSARSLMGVGRCYEKLSKPGLAVYYLERGLALTNQVNNSERLTALVEVGQLHFQMQEYAAAADAWEQALKLEHNASLFIRAAHASRLAGDLTHAEQTLSLVDSSHLSPADQIDYLDETAALADARGDLAASTRALLAANQIAPAAWRSYQIGLNESKTGSFEPAIVYLRDAVDREPQNKIYIQTLAQTLERSGDLDEASQLYRRLTRLDSGNSYWYKSIAYIDIRLNRNADSAAWLRKAAELTKGSPGENGSPEELFALRSEASRLTKNFSVTLYKGFMGHDSVYSGGASLFGSNPFPASAGIEMAYRPPKLGLRNGKSIEIFSRVLWSTPDNSLGFDTKLYQLSVGLRYKPIARQNLWISGERLLHTGTPDYQKWLLRVLYSWNPGFDLKPNKRNWNYTLVFSDSAFLPVGTRQFAQYGEFRQGVTLNVKNTFLITPMLVADARWQSNTSYYGGTYGEAGAGVSFRYLYKTNHFEAVRTSFEVVGQCKRGSLSTTLGARGFYSCSLMNILHF